MAKILLDIYCSTNILKTGLLWLDIFSFLFKEQTSWNTKNLRKTPLRNAPWQQSHPWHRRHLDIEMKSDTRRNVVSVNWGLESPWNGPWLLRIQSPNRHEELFWGGTPFGWIATNSVYLEDNGRCDCRRGAYTAVGSWSPCHRSLKVTWKLVGYLVRIAVCEVFIFHSCQLKTYPDPHPL